MNETVKDSSEERRTAILSARKILNFSDNRQKLVMCLLICAVSTVSVILMISALSLFAEFMGYFLQKIFSEIIIRSLPAILILTELLFSVPIYMGTYRVALMLQRGEPAEVSDVFFYYTSFRRYLRSLLMLFGAFASCRCFGLVTQMMLNSDMSMTAAARRVRQSTKGRRAAIFVFKMSFFMRILLGILTVGVLLLVHTIPLAMLSHAQYNETIKNS